MINFACLIPSTANRLGLFLQFLLKEKTPLHSYNMNVNTENLDKNFEHWASVDGYLNYQVSWWGRVVNTKTGRILKPGTSIGGYLFVILSKKGKQKIHYIHKLVAREWRANPDERPCVDHVDNDKTNNNHENLRWATLSENSRNMKNAKMVRALSRVFRLQRFRGSGMHVSYYLANNYT